MQKKKTIIIGAGPAGVTAGLELKRKNPNMDVLILEESDMIGGISRTVNHNGNRMDIGGHRFFSKDKKVNQFWEELLPLQGSPSLDEILLKESPVLEGTPNPEKEDRVFLNRRRVSRIFYNKKFFDYPISLKWETIKNMGFGTTIVAGFSYLKGTIFKKKETNLENFYENRFGNKLYSMFFEGYTEKLWGRHPKEISADWGSQRVKGLSIIAILKDMFGKLSPKKKRKIETSLIEEFHYPKYGPGQLWETAAIEFEKIGGKIIKNAKVTKVISDDTGLITSVEYTEKDGKVKHTICDYCISSMPLKDLVLNIENKKEKIPTKIKEFAKHLPYRDFVTIGLLFSKLELKNETKLRTVGNIVPDCWIYVQDSSVKLGRIQIFNNWSPYLVKDLEHTVWIGLEYFCKENDDFWNMSEDHAEKFAIHELERMGVIAKGTKPLDTHRERVKKAYPAYFDSYAHIDQIITYLNQYENLYCVGRNGQHRYNNMDHSMITAFETVNNILTGKTTKDNIWNVNTEKEYHEEEKKE